MKKPTLKLALRRETLRVLPELKLINIVGGAQSHNPANGCLPAPSGNPDNGC